MALFPAYADSSNVSKIPEQITENVPILSENEIEEAEEKFSLNVVKKKNKGKEYKKKRSKIKIPVEEINISSLLHDYYIDKKIDYGNLRVSTLYNPARPKYDNIKSVLGNHRYLYKKKERKIIRYYKCLNVNDTIIDETIEKPKKSKRKCTNDYISIIESGKRWDTENFEEVLFNKTAEYNKYLDKNPYEVNKWLEFVKFQEDRLAFDLSCKNISNSTTAKNNCYEKQLSILDAALKHNFNSIQLLTAKIKICEQSMTNDKYLTILKKLITTPELSNILLVKGWFWYLDAIQFSMALCSIPSVKELYANAIKVLGKTHTQFYQRTHVEITYRLGLFLRQAGLWEHLWMLIKLNVETNFVNCKDEKSINLDSITPKIDTSVIEDEETNILVSGLPLHEVWSRVELSRSKVQWLPSPCEVDDPQRIVFSTDVADFIKPISDKTNLFYLGVNILRIMKVPLLPMTQGISDFFKNSFEWEYDNIEITIPMFYCTIRELKITDPNRIKIMLNICKDFLQEPNYFDITGHYFILVNNIMLQYTEWFESDERTAILIWWMRFSQTLLAIHICTNPNANNKKQIINSIRKSFKDILKANRDNIMIYKEFSILEAQLSGIDKGLTVMETCLKTLPRERNLSRIHLSRSFIEMLMSEESNVQNNNVKMKSVLISLASNKPMLLEDNVSHDEKEIDDSLQEFADYTDTLLLAVSNYDKDMNLIDYMLPDIIADWICCHGWLILLTKSRQTFKVFCKKILIATHTEKSEQIDQDTRRKLHLREEFFNWLISLSNVYSWINEILIGITRNSLLEQALEEFPCNTYIVWYATKTFSQRTSSRWRLLKTIKSIEYPHVLVTAFILENFINLYKKYDSSFEDSWQPGYENRLSNLLQMLTSHPLLKKSALIWHMLIEFVACHTRQSTDVAKKFLYQALDEIPWNKALYYTGCVRIPSEFSALIDIMIEKQIRLHAMPEELQL